MAASSPHRTPLRFRRLLVGLWSALATTGCSSPTARDLARAPEREWLEEEQRTCFRLLQSPPAQWHDALPPTLRLGERAVEPLATLVREAPHAPGAPAATLAIGILGGKLHIRLLEDLLAAPNEAVAVEAALALGRRREATDVLRRVARTPSPHTLLRTAAAVGAVQAEPTPEMLEFLCDVLLAATPYGRARGQELGLPVDRPRWAAERNLASEALSRAAGRDLAIEPDASWPALRVAVDSARRHFGLSPR